MSNPQVLVVYNSNNADSLDVANHYVAARGIPPGNLCAISPSDPAIISLAEYTSATGVRATIRNCLNVAGPKSILYIVMSYMTPYAVGGYALDSYVADIWDKYTTQIVSPSPNAPHGYYGDAQNQGEVYKPFVSLATWRTQPRGYLIYSVWRLDASTPGLAKGLVDKAVAAEAGGGLSGSSGQACFDLLYGNPISPNPSFDFPDAGSFTGTWDLERAAEFVRSAGFTVNEDYASGFEPGGANFCSNAALYAGWYSLNAYSGSFNWIANGAIGFHLDSLSAANPRGGTNWAANAINAGITVTSGSMNEPFLQGLARPAGVFRNLLEGANVGDAFLRNTRWLKWVILNLGDPLYTPFPNGPAPAPIPVSLMLSPMEVVGGLRNSTATVILSSPAPASGLDVSVSADPTLLTVPSSVTIPGGSDRASFVIASATVTQYDLIAPRVVVDAGPTYGQAVNSLTLYPMLYSQVRLSQTSVKGGTPVTGTVFLLDRAPIAGVIVNLVSSNPTAASVPATVTVAAGSNSATFTINTAPVSANTDASITASYAGATTAPAKLTVTP
jgi:uncharacterized protein (TIGR03790 family)